MELVYFSRGEKPKSLMSMMCLSVALHVVVISSRRFFLDELGDLDIERIVGRGLYRVFSGKDWECYRAPQALIWGHSGASGHRWQGRQILRAWRYTRRLTSIPDGCFREHRSLSSPARLLYPAVVVSNWSSASHVGRCIPARYRKAPPAASP